MSSNSSLMLSKENTIDLSGKVVLITGASRGLGRAMARGMAEAGANLVLTARRESVGSLGETVESIGKLSIKGDVVQAFGDIANADDCETIIETARKRFGTVHVLINNAAAGMALVGSLLSGKRRFYDIPLDAWRSIVDTNVNGTFLMTRATIPLLLAQRWGRIVNLSTSYPTMIRAGYAPYGPSKAAIEALTVIMAQDLADSGVTANALLPGGPSDTRMMPREDWPDRTRLIQPSAMVPPVVWLASTESNGVTGMRIVAKDWNTAVPPADAFKAASARAGW